MVCERCRGLLVCEIFNDLNVVTNSFYIAARCINCGYIEDAVVRANRVSHSVITQTTPRRQIR